MEALGLITKGGSDVGMWYDVVINGGGMAGTPLFEAQAKKIISGCVFGALFVPRNLI